MSILSDFAIAHRLRVTKEASGEEVIAGRVGESIIAEHDEGSLCVAFVTPGKEPPRTGLFNTFKRACIESGMRPQQVGDAEGVFIFDPADSQQAKIAIRGIRARVKRTMSAEQAAACTARLNSAREAKAVSA